MKVAGKYLKVGQTVKLSSILEIDGKLSVGCGAITKKSPVIEIEEIIEESQKYKNLKGRLLITKDGREISISTRQKAEIIK
jgi:hypothetical protein